jgi:hypothetical protein
MKKKSQDVAVTPKSSTEVAPPDMVQVTLLVDASGSMDGVWSAAQKALGSLQKEVDCSLISIQSFNTEWKCNKDFESPAVSDLGSPVGNTNLYGAILKAITHSREAAALTPEFRAHHVFVVITDGESNAHSPAEYDLAQKAMKDIDVEATFFLLDSSAGQQASKQLGWTSTSFQNTPKSIADAIKKVQLAVNQIGDNVAKKLKPTANLLLPPARGVH